jgi:hypothetical protein
VHALYLLGPFPALIVEVEAKRSDARFRRDSNLVERSVQGVCPLTPIIVVERTFALLVAAPYLKARLATRRFRMCSTSKGSGAQRRGGDTEPALLAQR